MESKKIILMNLFAGQQWRNGNREQTYEHGQGEERGRCMERLTWKLTFSSVSSVQSLSRVRLFATPWIAARQASLSITYSWSSRRLMCVELVMPSSHLILCCPLLLLPPIPPSISIWHLYFSFWLTSLCIIGSRFVHLIRTDSNVFLFVAE